MSATSIFCTRHITFLLFISLNMTSSACALCCEKSLLNYLGLWEIQENEIYYVRATESATLFGHDLKYTRLFEECFSFDKSIFHSIQKEKEREKKEEVNMNRLDKLRYKPENPISYSSRLFNQKAHQKSSCKFFSLLGPVWGNKFHLFIKSNQSCMPNKNISVWLFFTFYLLKHERKIIHKKRKYLHTWKLDKKMFTEKKGNENIYPSK